MKLNAIGLLSVIVPAICAVNMLLPRTAEESSASSLAGSSWRLVKFMGGDDTVLTPADKAKYTIAFAPDGSLSVQIDCNRGRGTWKSPGSSQLEFGPLALTRAMCPAALNDRMAKTWQYVRSYVVKDGHLFLSLMADGGIYEFEPLATADEAGGHLKGQATYRERMALPPSAVFEATLEDVSRANARAEVIGRARIEQPPNPPIPFDIAYDTSRIDPRHSYTVRARIVADGKLFFTTDQHYPVLTGGHGNDVSLLLKRVAAPSSNGGTVTSPTAGAARLENTYWRLTQLGDTAITAASKQQAAHLILYSQTRLVSGSGGCNRVTGSYQLNGEQLIFSHMAGTMMACITGMDTEKAFLQALGRVNKWRITGRRLDLRDADGKVIASLEAR